MRKRKDEGCVARVWGLKVRFVMWKLNLRDDISRVSTAGLFVSKPQSRQRWAWVTGRNSDGERDTIRLLNLEASPLNEERRSASILLYKGRGDMCD